MKRFGLVLCWILFGQLWFKIVEFGLVLSLVWLSWVRFGWVWFSPTTEHFYKYCNKKNKKNFGLELVMKSGNPVRPIKSLPSGLNKSMPFDCLTSDELKKTLHFKLAVCHILSSKLCKSIHDEDILFPWFFKSLICFNVRWSTENFIEV